MIEIKKNISNHMSTVQTFIGLIFSLFLITSCHTENTSQQKMHNFLQISGTQLIDSTGQAIRLRGFGFGNEVWYNDSLPRFHHTEQDFARLQEMGMNSIRFYLNYKTFENDTPPFEDKANAWEWLDQNVAWAKTHGIYLVLNLHISHGGFQSQGGGDALWNDSSYQERLINFWKKIARRYQNESQIAGFGILNEPVPTESIQQWQSLAQKTIDYDQKNRPTSYHFCRKSYLFQK